LAAVAFWEPSMMVHREVLFIDPLIFNLWTNLRGLLPEVEAVTLDAVRPVARIAVARLAAVHVIRRPRPGEPLQRVTGRSTRWKERPRISSRSAGRVPTAMSSSRKGRCGICGAPCEATGRVDPPKAAEAANQLAIAQLHAQPTANTASMPNQFFGSLI
jgi:hypothetical protein